MATDFKLIAADKIGATPAVPLIPQAWCELLDKGHIWRQATPLHSTWPVVYAIDKAGVVGGFIHYWVADDGSNATIVLGWVDPAFRRQGLYRRLYERLREVCREKKVITIFGSTHITNDALVAAATALGRKKAGIMFTDDLAPRSEPADSGEGGA